MTLNEHLDEWLEPSMQPDIKEATLADYERLMRLYVRPLLGMRRLSQIAAPDVQRVYGAMQKQGLSSRTIQYTHTVLKKALSHAVRWRRISYNPAIDVSLPRREHREQNALSPEEAARFLEAAKVSRHYVLFAFLLTTGMRPSEAYALGWKDVDWATGAVRVVRKLTRIGGGWKFDEVKTARSRRSVSLPDGMVELLLRHKEQQAATHLVNDHELVFIGETGEPLQHNNILKRHFRPLLQRAGLPTSIRLYDLRHSCATLLLAAGENAKVVAERLGHSSTSITLDVYSHVLPDMQRNTANVLDSMLFNSQPSSADRPVN